MAMLANRGSVGVIGGRVGADSLFGYFSGFHLLGKLCFLLALLLPLLVLRWTGTWLGACTAQKQQPRKTPQNERDRTQNIGVYIVCLISQAQPKSHKVKQHELTAERIRPAAG